MKSSIALAIVLSMLLLFPGVTFSRHIGRTRSHHNPHRMAKARMINSQGPGSGLGLHFERSANSVMKVMRGPDTVEVAGSSLPDCSHACGSCSPCRLVMVSFVCASEEAETCPMAYKCMCKNKSYPVP